MAVSAIAFNADEVAAYYAARVPHLKQRRAAEWRGPCPIHDGKRDSFAVDPATGRWFCHSTCGRGGDIIEFEMALTGAGFKTAKEEVLRLVGRPGSMSGNRPPLAREVAAYDYRDEAGKLQFQTVRMDPKDFKQRRPNGNRGWVWNLKGVRRVLYRLPELLKRPAETVFICEGEKDVHSLEALGLLATCNPMGAGMWRPEYSEMVRGRSVALIPDNDPPMDEDGRPHCKGQKHAAAVASDLLRVGCKIRIVEVPKGKDVSDWLSAGGTIEEFRAYAARQPVLTSEALADWRARWELADATPHNPASRANAAHAGSLYYEVPLRY